MIRSRRLSIATTIAVCAGAGFIVAGCGDDDNGDSDAAAPAPPAASSSGGETLNISADAGGALKFKETSLTAKAGKVTIVMDNPSSKPHGVGIEGNGVDVHGETVEPGKTSTASADLKAGTYEYYCTIPSHKDAGMTGELTVE